MILLLETFHILDWNSYFFEFFAKRKKIINTLDQTKTIEFTKTSKLKIKKKKQQVNQQSTIQSINQSNNTITNSKLFKAIDIKHFEQS